MEAESDEMRAESRVKWAGSEHQNRDKDGVWMKFRMRINELEKEKLLLTSNHNQEVCALRAEVTSLRACVERSEAQRTELLYLLTISAAEKERAGEDQHALQQEVKEHDQLVQQLRCQIKDQQEALQENQRRREEEQRERQELELKREREERKHREEKEDVMKLMQQEMKTLQSILKAERAAHLQCQVRGRSLEVALQEAELHVQHLRSRSREREEELRAEQERRSLTEQALQRLRSDLLRVETDLSVALETEKKMTSDLSDQLEEERRRHSDTHTELQQMISDFLLELPDSAAKSDGEGSPDVLQLLRCTLSSARLRQEVTNQQVLKLQQQHSEQARQQEEAGLKMEEELSQATAENQRLLAEQQRERDKWASDRVAQEAELQQVTEESSARLSFLCCLYQRVVTGSILLRQPHCMLGNFTWQELCDVITDQVDQLTSDLRRAKEKVRRLLRVCQQRSVCVQRLECSYKRVLSQLKLTRSRGDALTSDLSVSQGEAASLLAACTLLAGALRHAHRRLLHLCQMKALLWRRLQEGSELEQEVSRLAASLGWEGVEPVRSPANKRWRRSLCVVLAVIHWQHLAENSNVIFWLSEVGGAMGVCDLRGEAELNTGDIQLHSAHLHSIVLSSMLDLQGALHQTGSAHIIPTARSALSHLLEHILDQSGSPVDALSGRVSSQPNKKAVVSVLQQHFLLFNQRLHSAEVERRSLRVELSNQRRGAQKEKHSLRILGKHLLELQCDRKQLRKQLKEAHRSRDHIIRWMQAAEMKCRLVTDSLSQSQCYLRAEPRPFLLLSETESRMGVPEVTACQSFLSSVSLLCRMCCSTIAQLQQQVPPFMEPSPTLLR